LHQHHIGYTADGFYRSKDPTNSIKVLKEMLQRKKQTTKTTKYTYAQTIVYTKKDIHIISTASPLVYTNTGVTRGQLPQRVGSPGLNGVGLPPQYPQNFHFTKLSVFRKKETMPFLQRKRRTIDRSQITCKYIPVIHVLSYKHKHL